MEEHATETILQYFAMSRGAGHTHTMVHGLINNDRAALVVPTYAMAQHVYDLAGKRLTTVTLEDIVRGKLRGSHRPLALDHTVIEHLLREAWQRTQDAEAEVGQMQSIIDDQRQEMLFQRSIATNVRNALNIEKEELNRARLFLRTFKLNWLYRWWAERRNS